MPRKVSRAMMGILIKTVEGVERDEDRRRNHPVFENQIIEPVTLERQVVALHCSLPFAATASGLTMVVLASHSPPSATVLRVFATKPRRSKKLRAVSLASTLNSRAPRAAASFSSASQSMTPAPCPAAAGCT